jgi:hypothetical protein
MSEHTTVPVDQRWLGMDKRAIPYAVVALVLIGVLIYVVPAVNGAVEFTDETVAGDVIDLGGGTTFTPPAGWLLEDGQRVNEGLKPVDAKRANAVLVNGGVGVNVDGSFWDGTADELLDQANRLRDNSGRDDDRLFKVTGERASFTTASGITGVSETFTSATGDGTTWAFVVGDGAGIVFTATTVNGTNASYAHDIESMVSSLTHTEPTS